MFNEFFARRTSQNLIFQNIYRAHGPIWRATQITREPLDGKFMREEFMRVNGHRAMPQLVGAAFLISPQINNFAWNHLVSSQTPSMSYKAECVQKQTQLTRQLAKVGLIQEPLQQVRADSTAQAMFLESMSRAEGVLNFLPMHERPDLQVSEDDDLVIGGGEGEGEGGGGVAIQVGQ